VSMEAWWRKGRRWEQVREVNAGGNARDSEVCRGGGAHPGVGGRLRDEMDRSQIFQDACWGQISFSRAGTGVYSSSHTQHLFWRTSLLDELLGRELPIRLFRKSGEYLQVDAHRSGRQLQVLLNISTCSSG